MIPTNLLLFLQKSSSSSGLRSWLWRISRDSILFKGCFFQRFRHQFAFGELVAPIMVIFVLITIIYFWGSLLPQNIAIGGVLKLSGTYVSQISFWSSTIGCNCCCCKSHMLFWNVSLCRRNSSIATSISTMEVQSSLSLLAAFTIVGQ